MNFKQQERFEMDNPNKTELDYIIVKINELENRISQLEKLQEVTNEQ